MESSEAVFGYTDLPEGSSTRGYLINAAEASRFNPLYETRESGLHLYFIDERGHYFRTFYPFAPYLLLRPAPGRLEQLRGSILRAFGPQLAAPPETVRRADLDTEGHLLGEQVEHLCVRFVSTGDQMTAARRLRAVERRRGADSVRLETDLIRRLDAAASRAGQTRLSMHSGVSGTVQENQDPLDALAESLAGVREHDVPYLERVFIDCDIRCAQWYGVEVLPPAVRGGGSGVTTSTGEESTTVKLTLLDNDIRPQLLVLAFDIETAKKPLRFPDADAGDQIMMISYMVGGKGFLIVNRAIVSKDIDDFDFTPSPEYPGPFTVWNVKDEATLLRRWFDHVREVKPALWVSFNGDFFDFPYIEKRAAAHGLSMRDEIGVYDVYAVQRDRQDDRRQELEQQIKATGEGAEELELLGKIDAEYRSRFAPHLDCFKWVQRDSYLPQGSQGLKAVTRAKLGFDPHELDPELMTPYADTHPNILADYSVSDAVCTYYLFYKYVYPFIFSLATIIPLAPDDVLRKGSGTLCEALLCVQAHKANVLYPEKVMTKPLEMMGDQLLQAQTYVGAKVEALNCGVYRSDAETRFTLDPAVYDRLIERVDTDIHFFMASKKLTTNDVVGLDEVTENVRSQLRALRDRALRARLPPSDPDSLHVNGRPGWLEKPSIFHLDVGAMYPNIILTNRLQPTAMRTQDDCRNCHFGSCVDLEDATGPSGTTGRGCQRRMEWMWRGEIYNATGTDVRRKITELQRRANWPRLNEEQRAELIKKGVELVSQKTYGAIKRTQHECRLVVVCQRENSFYVDTVRMFRDRRYDFKKLLKDAFRDKTLAQRRGAGAAELEHLEARCVLYESMQLAYKCILNSFYGYVMRGGARWKSMQMGGVVTYTGVQIIDQACNLAKGIGIPLELDTDGIWVGLPASFPADFELSMADTPTAKAVSNGRPSIRFNYPETMLNSITYERFVNPQYHTLVTSSIGGATPLGDPAWQVDENCSIYFEVDGPYYAMILPAALEKGKTIKKRYAVYNHDKTLAELKGFELKRRGELNLVKGFQQDIFPAFLTSVVDSTVNGIEGAYQAAGAVCDRWLNVVDMKGAGMPERILLDLVSEATTMSKPLAEFKAEGRRMNAITCAERMGELIGMERVADKGLRCTYIISRLPDGCPVTERTVPVTVFSLPQEERIEHLRRWTGDASLEDGSVANVLDWAYYRGRLEKAILKIVSLPGYEQLGINPVPRVALPDWKNADIAEAKQRARTGNLRALLAPAPATTAAAAVPSPPSSQRTGSGSQKQAASPAAPEPEPLGEMPHADADAPLQPVVDWLRRYWATGAGATNNATNQPSTSSAAATRPAAALQSRHDTGTRWHIVHAADAPLVGMVRVWAYVEPRGMTPVTPVVENGRIARPPGADLRLFSVAVPRTVVCNWAPDVQQDSISELESEILAAGGRAEPVPDHVRLPRGVIAFDRARRYTMPEWFWLDIEPRVARLSATSAATSIHGASTSLADHLITQVSAVALCTARTTDISISDLHRDDCLLYTPPAAPLPPSSAVVAALPTAPPAPHLRTTTLAVYPSAIGEGRTMRRVLILLAAPAPDVPAPPATAPTLPRATETSPVLHVIAYVPRASEDPAPTTGAEMATIWANAEADAWAAAAAAEKEGILVDCIAARQMQFSLVHSSDDLSRTLTDVINNVCAGRTPANALGLVDLASPDTTNAESLINRMVNSTYQGGFLGAHVPVRHLTTAPAPAAPRRNIPAGPTLVASTQATWEMGAMKLAAAAVTNIPQQRGTQVSLAQVTRTPLGNLVNGAFTALDYSCSRHLRDANHVLWEPTSATLPPPAIPITVDDPAFVAGCVVDVVFTDLEYTAAAGVSLASSDVTETMARGATESGMIGFGRLDAEAAEIRARETTARSLLTLNTGSDLGLATVCRADAARHPTEGVKPALACLQTLMAGWAPAAESSSTQTRTAAEFALQRARRHAHASLRAAVGGWLLDPTGRLYDYGLAKLHRQRTQSLFSYIGSHLDTTMHIICGDINHMLIYTGVCAPGRAFNAINKSFKAISESVRTMQFSARPPALCYTGVDRANYISVQLRMQPDELKKQAQHFVTVCESTPLPALNPDPLAPHPGSLATAFRLFDFDSMLSVTSEMVMASVLNSKVPSMQNLGTNVSCILRDAVHQSLIAAYFGLPLTIYRGALQLADELAGACDNDEHTLALALSVAMHAVRDNYFAYLDPSTPTDSLATPDELAAQLSAKPLSVALTISRRMVSPPTLPPTCSLRGLYQKVLTHGLDILNDVNELSMMTSPKLIPVGFRTCTHEHAITDSHLGLLIAANIVLATTQILLPRLDLAFAVIGHASWRDLGPASLRLATARSLAPPAVEATKIVTCALEAAQATAADPVGQLTAAVAHEVSHAMLDLRRRVMQRIGADYTGADATVTTQPPFQLPAMRCPACTSSLVIDLATDRQVRAGGLPVCRCGEVVNADVMENHLIHYIHARLVEFATSPRFCPTCAQGAATVDVKQCPRCGVAYKRPLLEHLKAQVVLLRGFAEERSLDRLEAVCADMLDN